MMQKRRFSPLALMIVFSGMPHTALASNVFPDWIVLAAASKAPAYSANTGAVVLFDDRLITVAPDGQATERERRVLKILQPRGREYAEIVARYSKDEKLDFFHAWKASGGVLHYSREYVVRELDLAPEKSADVKKLMSVITADENSSAVLKKKQ
jgi:hypothetical protein